MSDTTEVEEVLEVVEDEVTKESTLIALKKKADIMGIKYHHKIGVDKLTKLIDTTVASKGVTAKAEIPITRNAGKGRRLTQRQYQRQEAARLVRIRVACMNPAKKDWEGEIYTVSNSVVGTFKKYVPFNVDEGWHVPNIIYQHLLERECQIFYTTKGPRGNKIRKGKLIKELAIEVLDPLTHVELKELATQQAMANNLD